MPVFNVNLNISSSSSSGKGFSSTNINVNISSHSYDDFCDDFHDLGFHDDFEERPRLGSASSFSSSRGPRIEDGARDGESCMLDGSGRSAYSGRPTQGEDWYTPSGVSRSRDGSPPPMLRSQAYGASPSSRGGSDFETREVRPEYASYGGQGSRPGEASSYRTQEARPAWAERGSSSTRGGDGPSYRTQEARPSWADRGSSSTVRPAGSSSRIGSEYGSSSRTESRSRFGSDVPGRDTFHGSERGSCSTIRPERAAPSSSSRHESRRAQDSFSSSRGADRGFRTETVRPGGASSRSSSRQPRD